MRRLIFKFRYFYIIFLLILKLHNFLNSIYTINNEAKEKKKFIIEWLEEKFKNWLRNICKKNFVDSGGKY